MTVRGQKQQRPEAPEKRSRRKRARRKLPVREIIATAARTGWQDRWRVLLVAIVISTAAALLEIVAADLIDRTDAAVSVVSDLSSTSAGLLGTVFISGFLCRLVGHAQRGAEPASVWRVARDLPWIRLALADLLVGLLVLIGLVVFVIPGLVLLTIFGVVAPVIEIEERRVFAALRRSAHLVRPHFWWVLLLATLPVILLTILETAAPDGHSAGAILETLAIDGVGDAVIEAAIGLLVVTLCYKLIDLDARAGAGKRS